MQDDNKWDRYLAGSRLKQSFWALTRWRSNLTQVIKWVSWFLLTPSWKLCSYHMKFMECFNLLYNWLFWFQLLSIFFNTFFTIAPQGSPYLATPLGEVTKFIVGQVSNWSKVPCSREQQQQNWAPLGIEPGTFQSPGQCSNRRSIAIAN